MKKEILKSLFQLLLLAAVVMFLAYVLPAWAVRGLILLALIAVLVVQMATGIANINYNGNDNYNGNEEATDEQAD